MVRIFLTTSVVLIALLSSKLAVAFGIGEITLKSYLNQPLEAEIELLSVGDLTEEEVIPKLATEKDFAIAGVNREFFLTKLRFSVHLDKKNNKNFIKVRSIQPVQEPYIDFLVEILWPEGRLLREYTLLLDPPSYAGQINEVQAPPVVQQNPVVNQAANSNSAPAGSGAPSEPTTSAGTESSENYSSPVSQSSYESSYTSAPAKYETITTGQSDTLWSIASDARPIETVSVQQTMLAIKELNPDAFENDNINYLKKNQVLRIPDEDQIRAIATREALGIVADQNREWAGRILASGGQLPDNTAKLVGSRQVTPVAGDYSGDQLSVVAEGESDSGASGSYGGGSSSAGSSMGGPQNAKLLADNEILKQKVIASDRVISLKDQQIAELQERLRSLGEEAKTEAEEEIAAVEDQQQALEAEAAAQEAVEEEYVEELSTEEMEVATEMVEGTSNFLDDEAAVDSGGLGEELAAEENLDPTLSEDSGEAVLDGELAVESGEEGLAGGETEVGVDGDADLADAGEAPLEDKKVWTPPPAPEPESGLPILPIVGGVVVLLLLAGGGFFFYRKRKAGAANDGETAVVFDEGEEEGFDSFEALGGDDDENDFVSPSEGSTEGDPLVEAETYIAYGRHAQAIDLLKQGMDAEPTNAAIRLKLLECYAATGEQDAFEGLSAELLALDDSQSSAVDALRAQFGGDLAAGEDDVAELSLDDIGLDGAGELDLEASAEVSLDDLGVDDEVEFSLDDDSGDDSLDLSLDDLASELDVELEGGAEEPAQADDSGELDLELDLGGDDDGLDLDLGDDGELDLDISGDDSSSDDDLGLDIGGDDDLELELGGDDDLELELGGDDDLDLGGDDDLELELGGDDDLNLDLGEDDDLDLGGDDDLDLDLGGDDDDDLGLDLGDDDDDLSLDLGDDDLDLGGDLSLDEDDGLDLDSTVKMEADDNDSLFDGGEEDFDLPDDGDEAATKLDLARAYIDMGDEEGAKDILEEVVSEGNAEQKAEAESLIAKL